MPASFNDQLEAVQTTADFQDPVDKASFLEQQLTDEAVRVARLKAATTPKRLPLVPGECDMCGEETKTPQHLFCSTECRDEDEVKQRHIARMHKPTPNPDRRPVVRRVIPR